MRSTVKFLICAAKDGYKNLPSLFCNTMILLGLKIPLY